MEFITICKEEYFTRRNILIQNGDIGKYCVITLNPLRMQITKHRYNAIILKDQTSDGNAYVVCIGDQENKVKKDIFGCPMTPIVFDNYNITDTYKDDNHLFSVIEDYDKEVIELTKLLNTNITQKSLDTLKDVDMDYLDYYG